MKKKWRNIALGLGALISIFMLGACSTGNNTKETNEKLKVVVTNSILSDITENIAGDAQHSSCWKRSARI